MKTTNCNNFDSEQATQELNLNIKHQLKDKEIKHFTKIGYEFEKGTYVFLLIIPNIFRK